MKNGKRLAAYGMILVAALTFAACGKGKEVSTISGTVSEIKDFKFTIEDKDGGAYELTFEQNQPPKGLSEVKEGDAVKVEYTGELTEVDPFKGEVISVTKK